MRLRHRYQSRCPGVWIVRASLLISVPAAARLLSIGRNAAYDLIAAGTLPSIKLGRRRLVSVIALEAWIARQCGRIGESSG